MSGAADEPLTIVETADGETGHVRVAVSGELDLGTKETLDERLQRLGESGTPVVLDLSRLAFVDSAGLEVLVRHAQAAARAGVELRVERELTRHVRRLFELTGVGDLLWPDHADTTHR